MVDIQDHLDGLSANKRTLLEMLVAERTGNFSRDERVRNAASIATGAGERYEPFPLNEIQEAYLIGRSGVLELGNVSIHAYEEVDVAGLDVSRLQSAWRRLIDRHDMLRAVIYQDEQSILEGGCDYVIEVEDLRGKSAEQKQAYLCTVRNRMSGQVLPLGTWPLFEVRVSILDGEYSRIHISIDGLIVDGWSCNIIFGELVRFYENPRLELPDIELTFREYLLAERRLKRGERYQKSAAYWKSKLEGIAGPPGLPRASETKGIGKGSFVRRSGLISAADWARLQLKARRARISPVIALLLAYSEILGLWSRSARFIINVPRSNRLPVHPAVNSVVGPMASFSLLEVDTTPEFPFAERARRIQGQLWRDLDHGYVSGVEIAREFARTRGIPPGVTAPVVFTSTVGLGRVGAAGQLKKLGKLVYGITQTPQVWLDNLVAEENGALVYDWDGVEELFCAGVLSDMFDAYGDLLHRMADDDRVWIEQTVIGPPCYQLDERTRECGNALPLVDHDIVALFRNQVSARGMAPAVISVEKTISYQELGDMSSNLSCAIMEMGASEVELIPVVMEKGWEQVVAVAAITESGAAYVPIDAHEPVRRVAEKIEESRAKIVLTQARVDSRMSWPAGVVVLCVDRWDWKRRCSFNARKGRGEGLAFVMYTSGTTGRPKGAMITRRGLLNALLYTNERFRIGVEDRVLSITGLHHDMSAYDLFGMLIAGGAVVIPEEAERKDPACWARLIRDYGVTIWNSVPAMLEMLVEYVDGRSELLGNSLRLAFVGGDWIDPRLPGRLKIIAGRTAFVSVGGPTETTLWNIMHECVDGDEARPRIPYGRPIANNGYLILKSDGRDSPTWVIGEMYCSGEGVAKGYWGREVESNERFVDIEGQRMYRTGDLGRYLPGGEIEIVGRADNQVKIGGERIELEEIEAVIREHKRVKGAVVIARDGGNRTKDLIACILAAEEDERLEAELSGPGGRMSRDRKGVRAYLDDRVQPRWHQSLSKELEGHLRAALPWYMIPARFITVPEITLTSNGKINRKAMKERYGGEQRRGRQRKLKWRTEQERALVEVWKEVLGLEEVGIDENFFDLGGNSIHVVRVHKKLRQKLAIDIPVTDLFRNPNIKTLSEYLAEGQTTRFKFAAIHDWAAKQPGVWPK